MTSGPAQVGHRHQCPGVAGRHGFPSAALVVMPWATSPTRRAAVTVGGNELAHRAPGEGRHTTIFSEGHSIVRRTHRRRVVLREEKEDCLPGEEWTCALLLSEVDPMADESNGTRLRWRVVEGHCVAVRHLDERWERNEFADLRTACAACEKDR
ncbi:hypothetical protein TcBrA4_0075350 [Trypanosoma cruzi]|nr:hypothetical protein TcBrA4_0075350 [Trypanosoma cruzi]